MQHTVLYTVCFSDFYGTQRNVLSTASRLDSTRYRPLVAAPHGAAFFKALKSAGVKVFPLPFENVFDIGTAYSLSRIIRRENVSLVHAHLGISTVLSLTASTMSGGVPVIATRHFIEDRYATIKNRVLYFSYMKMYRSINARLKRVIFVSEAVRRGVEMREGPLGKRGIVIHNGVNISEVAVKKNLEKSEIGRIRELYGVPADSFLVVTLSRLVPEKGLDVLMETAVMLKEKGYYFIVAGDGPLREKLHDKIKELNVGDNVRLTGYVETSRDLMAAADAFVLAAHAEPFGIALIEAMASGTPVVAARAGGPLEIIVEGESGLFFEPGVSYDLAAKLTMLKNDTVLSERLAEGAKERTRDFDERTIACRIQSVYDDILSREIS